MDGDEEKWYRNGGTGAHATGLRDMHPHLQRTPRSRSPRRWPWTPGACRPRSPHTRSFLVVMRTSRPRTRCSPPPRRCQLSASTCLQSGESATKSQRHRVHRKAHRCTVVRRREITRQMIMSGDIGSKMEMRRQTHRDGCRCSQKRRAYRCSQKRNGTWISGGHASWY